MKSGSQTGRRMAWRVVTALVLALVPAGVLSTPEARSAHIETIPSSVFDPYSVGWASVRNMTSAQYSAHFDEMGRQDYMVIDIEVDQIDGTPRVGAIWQKNVDERGWAEWRNLSNSAFHEKWEELATAGYRLIDQEAYVLGDEQLYAGVWTQNVEDLEWASYRNVTGTVFAQNFTRYSEQGYMMIDIEAYLIDAEPRYAAVWVENTEDLDWVEWRNLTSAEFAEKFAEYQDDYRMIDVESYLWNGVQYYAGIWVENVDGRVWAEWRDMSAKGFGDKWLELRDAGYRLINYEVYPTAAGIWRYAGIWRQNGIRPVWPQRGAVTNLVEDYVEDNDDIPGLSVAIYHDGQFVYLRGFGFADVDDAIIAHSRTIYRTASVAKAVAGVFGIHMDESGVVDLANPTSTYISGLPAAHSHTLGQTLTNRSGIGHYSTHPSVSGQFDTDQEAVEELWGVPPFYTPGTVYTYSTHAYTYFGAALEGAYGGSSEQIYDLQLRLPFNLNTLRPEDRSVPHKFRATLYNISNDEVAADNLSWKRWGGGLESSVYDLARLGIHLLNNTILDEAATDLLWTPPDALRNYAYGWDTGTHLGRSVVGKAGAQNGARSYIRIYPDDDLVIVVMSNRRGHDTRGLAIDIAEIVLNAGALNQAGPLDLAGTVPIEDIEEPEDEAQDPAEVVWPVHNPAATPSEEDLEEEDLGGVNSFELYLPLIVR